jgi:hypothetical protein
VAKATIRMVDGETYFYDVPGIPAEQAISGLVDTEPGTKFVRVVDATGRSVVIAAGYVVSVLIEPS